MTYDRTGDGLGEGKQIMDVTDFVEPSTAYALVVQAANQDGPGPYSEQHIIRTMSRGKSLLWLLFSDEKLLQEILFLFINIFYEFIAALPDREGPPKGLRVEPQGQRSASVEWDPPDIITQKPTGYELFFIKADAKIWEDELASIDDW